MKYTFIAVISAVAFSQMAVAQTGSCAAQDVFDRCLSMEDEYLKTCTQQDYACLCKWHQAKLSCYDNCPNNLGRASQLGLKDTFCSIVEAQNKTASALNSMSSATTLPTQSGSTTLSPISPSTVVSNNNTINNSNAKTSSSSSSSSYYGHGILLCLAGVSTYFLI